MSKPLSLADRVRSFSLNRVVSSAYSRSLRVKLPIDKPGIHSQTHDIRWSMTQLKSSGVATQPCLTPENTENEYQQLIYFSPSAAMFCLQYAYH
uniref:Uncharacterized protein n=1 Tax=Salarias fasciatus TaxID=181472 RepID=A0A672H0B8_SALFA